MTCVTPFCRGTFEPGSVKRYFLSLERISFHIVSRYSTDLFVPNRDQYLIVQCVTTFRDWVEKRCFTKTLTNDTKYMNTLRWTIFFYLFIMYISNSLEVKIFTISITEGTVKYFKILRIIYSTIITRCIW